MSGWISLDRAITKHWLWQCEKFTKGQAWIDLLLFAAHTDNKVLIKGVLISVSRGEQIRSQVTLAKAWNWDRKTVARFLKLLEKDGMIVSRVDHLTSYVSICNYDSFQDNTKQSPQHKGQVKGQQSPSTRPTINKGNKDNKDNNTNEPDKMDYSRVKLIFNKYFCKGLDPVTGEKLLSCEIKQLTPKRKKLIDSFFNQTKLDLEKFEFYIKHVSTESSWLYFRKVNIKNSITYSQRPFDFYMTLDNYVKASEEKQNNG
jgi:hypothetical protein